VRTYALDGFLSERQHRVSFIKCDVEGAELEVFRGAEGILRNDRPALLFECECRHHANGRIDGVFEFLAGMGYVGQFFDDGRLRPIREFDASEHQRTDGDRFFDERGYCNNFAFVAASDAVV
jgi:hypothetical protein